MNNVHILVVDDEKNVRIALESTLAMEGYSVHSVANSADALALLSKESVDLVLLDMCIGKENGMDLYQELRTYHNLPVIFISGNASLSEAADTIKNGAFDFIEKPCSRERLLATVTRCVDYFKLKDKLALLENEQDKKILGEHASIKKLLVDIDRVAKSTATVFISGESGTGKELIARTVHAKSQRAAEAFVKVNCSAIPETLIESALFGHTRGAFTGASANKRGFFEMADGGTLFLDEIGDMPLSAQASLLRVLESSEIQKVGSETVKKVDVRVLAASHRDLHESVLAGKFRHDLLYRISVIPLMSPPLRERKEDIPLLAQSFVEEICTANGLKPKLLAAECIEIFKYYAWPGNIREMRNVIERMVILGGEIITKSDLPTELLQQKTTAPDKVDLTLRQAREAAERELILDRLAALDGNISLTAQSLEIDRTNLYKKMSLLGIKKENIRFKSKHAMS